MTNDQARIGEAIASLAARLDAWGVEEPQEKAHVFVHDMLRNGWRPRAMPVETPTRPTATVPSEARIGDVRAALLAARSELCSHGTTFANCHEPHDKPTPTTKES